MTETDEDSIMLSMEEYALLQNDMLNLKHENSRLKENSEKYEDALRQLQNTQEEFLKYKQTNQENPLKKIQKFSKEIVMNCLKSVRKNEELDREQMLLSEQIIAIIEYI